MTEVMITRSMRAIYDVLQDRAWHSVSEISKKAGVTRPTASSVLVTLQAGALVEMADSYPRQVRLVTDVSPAAQALRDRIERSKTVFEGEVRS